MSNEFEKFKNSRRRQKTTNAINKQIKIAKNYHLYPENHKLLLEKHRMAKHHIMDCGNPECYLCGNPRKTHKDKLTMQEKRFLQDVDNIRDKHSNGLKNDEEKQ